jgi:hypothetical protein
MGPSKPILHRCLFPRASSVPAGSCAAESGERCPDQLKRTKVGSLHYLRMDGDILRRPSRLQATLCARRILVGYFVLSGTKSGHVIG